MAVTSIQSPPLHVYHFFTVPTFVGYKKVCFLAFSRGRNDSTVMDVNRYCGSYNHYLVATPTFNGTIIS